MYPTTLHFCGFLGRKTICPENDLFSIVLNELVIFKVVKFCAFLHVFVPCFGRQCFPQIVLNWKPARDQGQKNPFASRSVAPLVFG